MSVTQRLRNESAELYVLVSVLADDTQAIILFFFTLDATTIYCVQYNNRQRIDSIIINMQSARIKI